MRLLVAVLALAACKPRTFKIPDEEPDKDDAAIRDAAPPDAPPAWPELATYTKVEPVRVVSLPIKASEPRLDVVGPVIAGDLAIVGGSQLGFVAVDWRRGAIAWRKPASGHVAPPVIKDGNALLVADCADSPLGCLRVVSPAGADLAFVPLHGALGDGPQHTWLYPDGKLGWQRGAQIVTIDPLTGIATPTTEPDAVVVRYKDRSWAISQAADHTLVAKGKPAWSTKRSYGALVGAVYLPDQAPMIRTANANTFAGTSEVMLNDIDATGSMHGQVAFPVPGAAILATGVSSVGDAALAIRLDASQRRDFIAGFAANALLMWVYPLPVMLRPDPIGVAVAPEAVVVFHDGDTVTVLPELSAPPTAPGAIRAPLENPTP